VIHLSHSVTFATVAFLIISTVVTHRRLMVISSNNSQWCMVTWSCNICMWYLQYRTVNCRHVQHSIMTNVTLQRVDQSVKQLIDGHTTISDNCLDTQHPALSSQQPWPCQQPQLRCRYTTGTAQGTIRRTMLPYSSSYLSRCNYLLNNRWEWWVDRTDGGSVTQRTGWVGTGD